MSKLDGILKELVMQFCRPEQKAGQQWIDYHKKQIKELFLSEDEINQAHNENCGDCIHCEYACGTACKKLAETIYKIQQDKI